MLATGVTGTISAPLPRAFGPDRHHIARHDTVIRIDVILDICQTVILGLADHRSGRFIAQGQFGRVGPPPARAIRDG